MPEPTPLERPANDDPLRAGWERRRPWLWLLAVVLGGASVARRVHDGGLDVGTCVNIALAIAFWFLLVWRWASTLDRGEVALWRGLTLGWGAYAAVLAALEVVSIARGDFRGLTLVGLVFGALMSLATIPTWRRTARGLPPLLTEDEMRERRERRLAG
ncbi:hypothetical protein BH11ACT8_BH11ACT8_31980 [soil metagenome]